MIALASTPPARQMPVNTQMMRTARRVMSQPSLPIP
jgi:hypothetical protein